MASGSAIDETWVTSLAKDVAKPSTTSTSVAPITLQPFDGTDRRLFRSYVTQLGAALLLRHGADVAGLFEATRPGSFTAQLDTACYIALLSSTRGLAYELVSLAPPGNGRVALAELKREFLDLSVSQVPVLYQALLNLKFTVNPLSFRMAVLQILRDLKAAGGELNDLLARAVVMSKLPQPDWDAFCKIETDRSGDPRVDDLLIAICDEAKRRSARTSTAVSDTPVAAAAINPHPNGKGRVKDDKRPSDRDKRPPCSHCNKPGHDDANCFLKYPAKKAEYEAKRKSRGGRRDKDNSKDKDNDKARANVAVANGYDRFDVSFVVLSPSAYATCTVNFDDQSDSPAPIVPPARFATCEVFFPDNVPASFQYDVCFALTPDTSSTSPLASPTTDVGQPVLIDRMSREEIFFTSPHYDIAPDHIIMATPVLQYALSGLDATLKPLVAVDSGASRHMGNDSARFTTLTLYDATKATNVVVPSVQMGSGVPVPVTGVGTMRIVVLANSPSSSTAPVITTLNLANALYIPELQLSLVSAGNLTYSDRDNTRPTAHEVILGGTTSRIQLKNGIVVPLKLHSANLFVFDEYVESVPSSGEHSLVARVLTSRISDAKLMQYHISMGHPCWEAVCLFLDVPFRELECPACLLLKTKRQPLIHVPNLAGTASKPGQLTHVDFTGPFPVPTEGGALYVGGSIDDFSGMPLAALFKTRSSPDKMLQLLLDRATEYGVIIGQRDILQSDNEFLTEPIRQLAAKLGLIQRSSPPGTPQRNAKIERHWLTVHARVRVMLYMANCPLSFWGMAWMHAEWLLARTPLVHGDHHIPLEKYRSQPLSVIERQQIADMPPFGAPAYVHDTKAGRLEPAARPAKFVGFNSTNSSFILFMTDTNSLAHSVHVRFGTLTVSVDRPLPPPSQDLIQFFLPPMDALLTPPAASTASTPSSVAPTSSAPTAPAKSPEVSSKASVPVTAPVSVPAHRGPVPAVSSVPSAVVTPADDLLCAAAVTAADARAAGYSLLEMFFPSGLHEDLANIACFNAIYLPSPSEPKTYLEALKSPDSDKWIAAVNTEMAKMHHYNTFAPVLLSDVPPDADILRSHWILKHKYEGHVVKEYKARLVIDGNLQQIPDGADKYSYYSPVTSLAAGRMLLSHAAANGHHTVLMDVEAAFLHVDMKPDMDVYMEMPRGWPNTDDQGRRVVQKLRKYLYGMRDSPRAFWEALSRILITHNRMIQCPVEPCLFARDAGTPNALVAVTTVDDILAATPNADVKAAFIKALQTFFKLSRVTNGQHWLNIDIEYDMEKCVLAMSQSAYIDRVFRELGLSDCPFFDTPMATDIDLVKDLDTLPVLPLDGIARYQRLIGVALYLANTTKLDMPYPVNQLARFMTKPNDLHYHAVLRLMGYIRRTRNLALTYRSNYLKPFPRDGRLNILQLYVDASYGGDDENRHSTCGYIACFNGAAVLTLSKLIKVIVLSSAEAEFITLAVGLRAGTYLIHVAEHLGALQPRPLPVFEDNMPAINLAHNPIGGKLSKHIDIKAAYVREQVQLGNYKIVYCPSPENAADLNTKPLPAVPHRKHRAVTLGCDLKPPRPPKGSNPLA
jgi:Reverse transcriptase (RNA-dependent DNA polymerase)/Integrase core domain